MLLFQLMPVVTFMLATFMLACGDKTPVTVSDADGDGYAVPEDCDDTDVSVNPDAVEWCNEVDDDCNGMVDDAPSDGQVWHEDADGDGYGDPVVTTVACQAPDGFVDNTTDCDDDDPTIHPDAPELCDGLDNDCDDSVDEDPSDAASWYADVDGDGFGDGSDAVAACSQPTGTVADATDCNDLDSDVYPGAPELCNDADDDCDDVIDEDPTDGYTWYVDTDEDGFGDDSAPILSCVEEAGTIDQGGDCDDGADTVFPGAPEVCGDGLVNDCDGDVNSASATCGGWGDPVDVGADAATSLAATDEAWLGATLAGGFDLDDDGCDDVLTGAFLQDGTGVVRLQRFSDGGLVSSVEEIAGLRTDQELGSEVAGLSDLDGDGRDELLIAATASDDRGQGQIFLLPGQATTPTLADALAVWSGVDDGELAGTEALVAVGDVDGDGLPDFMAGARYGSLGATYAGQAYVVSATATGEHDLSESSARLYATGSYGYAATRVAGPGDLNGDGIDDVVVDGSGDDAAWIALGPLSGDVDLTADADVRILDGTALTLTDVVGGDVDGDGTADLVMSSVNDSTLAERAGAVFVHLGPFGADVGSDRELTDATAMIQGQAADGYLGGELALLRDVDGDDQVDLLVGTGTTLIREGSVSSLGGRGWAYVYGGVGSLSGTLVESDADLSFFNDVSGDSFGMDVAAGGDLNADGRSDLVIAGAQATWGGGTGDVWTLMSDLAY